MDTDCPKDTSGNVFDILHVNLIEIKIKVNYVNGPLEKKKKTQMCLDIDMIYVKVTPR